MGQARRRLPQIVSAGLQFLREPGATLRPLHGQRQALGMPQHGADVGPDDLVELLHGDQPRAAPCLPAGEDRMHLPATGVVGIAPARLADTRQAAMATADQRP